MNLPFRVTDHEETPAEEVANVITHGVAAVIAVQALGELLQASWPRPLALLSSAAFGLSLILLYLASSCYHASRQPEHKARWRRLDHLAIYGLMAGSYTPYCLLGLDAGLGLPLLGVVLVLAALGGAFEMRWGLRYTTVSMFFYLGLGWLALLVAPALKLSLCAASFNWMVAGGLLYTVGVFFYATHFFRFSHAVWHLFVMGASACHFQSIWLIVSRS